MGPGARSRSAVKEGTATVAWARPPDHLVGIPWLDYEKDCALALCDSLLAELARLSKRLTAGRVHDTRVALRRWFSLWWVLDKDRWQTKGIKRKVLRKLRQLLSELGRLRDWDVNIELAGELGCPATLTGSWERQRTKLRGKVRKQMKRLDADKLISRLRRYIERRPEKLKSKLHDPSAFSVSAYEHLERYVAEQEDTVRSLEAGAQSEEELHQLRLAVKRWRYLLTEFFGVTNLKLVRTQQTLGRLNDLSRLQALVAGKADLKFASQLDYQRKKLLAELEQIRKELPYGLRPQQVSFEPSGRGDGRSDPAKDT